MDLLVVRPQKLFKKNFRGRKKHRTSGNTVPRCLAMDSYANRNTILEKDGETYVGRLNLTTMQMEWSVQRQPIKRRNRAPPPPGNMQATPRVDGVSFPSGRVEDGLKCLSGTAVTQREPTPMTTNSTEPKEIGDAGVVKKKVIGGSPYDCKCRAYQITVFDDKKVGNYIQVMEYLRGLKLLDYVIACWEVCPSTLREHWHIYCHFNNSVKLSQKKCLYSHLEVVRGSVDDNINYVKKIGKHKDEWNSDPQHHLDLIEWGEIPKDKGGQLSGTALLGMSRREIVEYDPRCHKAYLGAKQILEEGEPMTANSFWKKVKVYYIQGPSGAGKTTKDVEMIADLIGGDTQFDKVKYADGFWKQVSSRKCALYDEWRSSHMKPSEFINFIDYSRHSMNTKGSDIMNEYELIIITSIEWFDEIYSGVGGEPRLQWERRIEVIDMYGDTPRREKKPPGEKERDFGGVRYGY